MANIKRQLREFRGDNKLKNYVIGYILRNYTTEEDIKGFISDVLQYGCQSGIVGELIYYVDTGKFYKKYQADINELLQELIQSTGMQMQELFRSFDESDPLVLDYLNQNLLSWFGFEQVVGQLEAELC